jgi:beta-xylosidase
MKRIFFFLLLTLTFGTLSADEHSKNSTMLCNPYFWSDLPDPDIIRVDSDYYLVTTTMHLMPGAPIMHSRNLVDWNIDSYLFDRLTDSPRYDMNEGTVYGRGQWATTLRYRNGTFYALFAPNDERGGDSYVYSTTDPKKGWTLHSRLPHFHDSSFLFDDDGRNYIIHGSGKIFIRELNADLTGVQPGGVDQAIIEDSTETGLLEGSRALKHNGYYYIFNVSWRKDKPRREVVYRSKSITGPYEKRVALQSTFGGFSYAGQGTLFDTPDGKWYGLIFQDRGAVGRVLTLSPCRWVDGWPVLGDEKGEIPVKLPVQADHPVTLATASDDFAGPKLDERWQWNHNPEDDAWSLNERKGWLRLKTSRVTSNLFLAPNTLSQRTSGPRCTAQVLLDFSKMKDGDHAGFSCFNDEAANLDVRCKGGKHSLVFNRLSASLDKTNHNVAAKSMDGQTVDLTQNRVWLRIDCDFRPAKDLATFYYSLDGKQWNIIGQPFKMTYDWQRFFMGNRYAVYNYATRQSGGYVDVDYFHAKVLP